MDGGNRSKKLHYMKILEKQEKERQRIARELHDSTIQVLASLLYKTELCSKKMDEDLISAKLELEIINRTIHYIIRDMRDIIYDLRPVSLDKCSLEEAINKNISLIKTKSNINIELKITGKEEEGLDPLISLTIFRVIQEACNNAIKHSEANNVYITVNYENEKIEVSVKDDGKGFDAEKTYPGLGLSIMKERIDLLSGKYKIKTSLKEGTEVSFSVLLK